MTTIAVLKEVKDNENRVALIPSGVEKLVALGHKVIAQNNCGTGVGFTNENYKAVGAEIMNESVEIAKKADIIVKVKEPISSEYVWLQNFQGKTLYTYLHLSGVDPQLTTELIDNNITAIAYETMQDENGFLPLLAPMSEVAGVLAVQYGAEYLQKKHGGVGVTLGAVTGTERANVVVMGCGVVGKTAAKTALGHGSSVDIFDIRQDVLDQFKEELLEEFTEKTLERMNFIISDENTVSASVKDADLLIGAVLIAGAKAPQVVSENQIRSMKNGAVIVDVSIDQGGCIWGAKCTSHSDPIYEIDGKIFCNVANMPGQVAKQSTQALTSATYPLLEEMVKNGVENTIKNNSMLQSGVNVSHGKIRIECIAKDLQMEADFEEL